jgi:outer membrane immunogenic protein
LIHTFSAIVSGIVWWITHTAERTGKGRSARPVAVDGVGDENTDADNAEERGDCIQHGEDPKSQRIDLTVQLATQSKEFRGQPDFENGMRIFGNRTAPVRDKFWPAASLVIDTFADRAAAHGVRSLSRRGRKIPQQLRFSHSRIERALLGCSSLVERNGAMKKILLGAIAYFAATMTAFAADLAAQIPPPAPLPVPVIYSWTGCYFGAEGGGNWGQSQQIARSGPNAALAITGKFNLSGSIAGGTVGCNVQFSNFVVSIENDYSWTDKKGSANDMLPFNPAAISSTREKWIDTLRPRFGYAIDRFLVYGTVGIAWAGTSVNVVNPAIGAFVTDSKTRTGWTAGVGAEWAAWVGPWGAVTFKLEYLHVGFPTKQYVIPPVVFAGGTVATRDASLSDDMVRVGMNVKFNWGEPLVARY